MAADDLVPEPPLPVPTPLGAASSPPSPKRAIPVVLAPRPKLAAPALGNILPTGVHNIKVVHASTHDSVAMRRGRAITTGYVPAVVS